MAFEELQERLKSEAAQFMDKLSEQPTVQSLRDRYDTLTPTMQKVVVGAGLGIFTLLLASIPYGYYTTSQDTMITFQEKRDLIRDLLRTQKEAQEIQGSASPPQVSEVQGRIDSILNNSQILPEQKKGITADAASALINPSLVAGVVRVQLEQLNLRQITDLSAGLASIQGAKLKDILMDANRKDPRYFDVVYRVVVFKSSAEPEAPNGGNPPPAGRGGR